jgi:hypothetical protein
MHPAPVFAGAGLRRAAQPRAPGAQRGAHARHRACHLPRPQARRQSRRAGGFPRELPVLSRPSPGPASCAGAGTAHSVAAANSFSANAVGQMALPSRVAISPKPNVPRLEPLCDLGEADDLASFAYADIPYHVSRREVRRARCDDRVNPLGHRASLARRLRDFASTSLSPSASPAPAPRRAAAFTRIDQGCANREQSSSASTASPKAHSRTITGGKPLRASCNSLDRPDPTVCRCCLERFRRISARPASDISNMFGIVPNEQSRQLGSGR